MPSDADKQFPPSWYGPDGELDAEAKKLIALEEWIGEHGLPKGPEFDAFCVDQGIDQSELTMHFCNMPEEA